MRGGALALAAAALALAAAPAPSPEPRPLLWKVAGETPSYLFGTIHVPDRRVLDLPEPVEKAYRNADVVVTEIPLDDAAQLAIMPRLLLPDEQTLADVLPKPLYERTDALLRSHGLSIAVFARFQPWALATQLELLDYLKSGGFADPLDRALYRRAQADGKKVAGLETIDEQLAIFESLDAKEQVEYLEAGLEQLEKKEPGGKSATAHLVDLYLAGDETALLREIEAELPKDSKLLGKLKRLLIDERNARMARRIAERIAAEPERTFFFAIGAGHLAGPNGVPALLRRRGVAVARVP